MKLLILCPHYAPDVAPTGEVMTSIATALADRGHELHVVTSLPWYREHRVEPGWGGRLWRTERTSWGRITRLHPFPTDKTNIPARAVAFAGFTGLATVAGLVARGRPDAVMVMSPPLPLGVAGWLAAASRRAPFVFNIQDVFPDVAVELGAITNPRVIAAASWLERFLYRRADAVTVLSEDLRDNVAGKLRGRRPERVEVIPNFVDTERIAPAERENSYRTEYGLSGRTVVMYAGNVGLSQSLDLVSTCCWHRDEVVFVINGDSSALDGLRHRCRRDNLRFPMQPRERLAEVLAAGDLHLVPLRTGLARSSVPSKLYSILAAGRPCWPASTPTPRSRRRSSVPVPVSRSSPRTPMPSRRADGLLADPDRLTRWARRSPLRRGLGVARRGGAAYERLFAAVARRRGRPQP
jgi:colanic acid biosynthesis glycosyl transferase WcaI